MTLEDKLLDRLEKLVHENAKLARLADENYRDLLRTRDERDTLQIQYNQVCAAHDQLVERWRLSEDKPKRKRGGK